MQEVSQDYRTLAAYLKVRGLPTDSVTLSQAGIEFAGPNRCREALGLKPDSYDKRLGIIYHYPGSTYSTVRWFGKYLGAFGTVIDRKTDNPIGLPGEAYLSPLNDWSAYEGTLYLCESVLKALVLSRTGRYCVAGSGVWGLCPKGLLLLPEALRVGTVKVVILFDNDWKRNAQVRASIRRLGNLVKERWQVEVVHGQIPDPPTGSPYWDVEFGKNAGKWGVDDAIAFLGEGVLDQVKEVEIEPTEVELLIDRINTQFCFCNYPVCVIEKANAREYSVQDWSKRMSNERVWIGERLHEGSKVWLGNTDRSYVDALDYRPGEDGMVEGQFYNHWRDDGPVSAAGSVDPFLRVYENAIPDANIRSLLFHSFAWMLQNRGTKLEKTFIFIGRQVGTGKSLLAETVASLFGESNSVSIGIEDFRGDFNGVYAQREIVLIDDTHRFRDSDIAKLRRYTTDSCLVVNSKGVKQYKIKNSLVFFLTTNVLGALAMDDAERRNLVVEFEPTVHYDNSTGWWKTYVDWLEGGGRNALRAWFESMDLSGFDPHFMPPMTAMKLKMIDAGKSDDARFASALKLDADGMLGDIKRSVFATHELRAIQMGYVGEADKGLTAFGREIAIQFNLVGSQKQERWFKGDRRSYRLWGVRPGCEKWTKEECLRDIEKFRDFAPALKPD